MSARLLWPLFFSAFVLSGCIKNEEQTKELSNIRAQIVEQSSRIQDLEDRLSEVMASSADAGRTIDALVEYIEAIRDRLQAMSDSQDVAKMLKEDRKTDLVALELWINEVADHLQKLNDQVADVRKVPAPAPVVVQPRPVAPVVVPERKKVDPIPTFDLIGIEYRGQEPFLALVDKGSNDLSAVKLLQPSDTVGGWRLKSFDAYRAVFVVDGRDFVIALP